MEKAKPGATVAAATGTAASATPNTGDGTRTDATSPRTGEQHQLQDLSPQGTSNSNPPYPTGNTGSRPTQNGGYGAGYEPGSNGGYGAETAARQF